MRVIKRLLVANRSEVAIRVFRAATELGISTVAIYAEEDKLSLHRFKSDESYLIGRGEHLARPMGPLESYLSIDEIIRVALLAKADAIHPGYGFLSESPEFADACARAGLIFVGPRAETMRLLGDKVSARKIAEAAGVPVTPATGALPESLDEVHRLVAAVGYPVMLKASWGGGGRGMRVIDSRDHLGLALSSGRSEARSAFGKDEVYVEKLVRNAQHIEVQLLGDAHGTIVHLFERDCSIQRRHQKLVERAPAPFLSTELRHALCDAALRIGRATQYCGAATVEFLVDRDSGAFYFMEVNPRIQVEHTVTEVVTGIDIVKAQIRIAEGARIGKRHQDGSWEAFTPDQARIALNGHAVQCRITTEDPENNFIPDFGRITAYRGAFGFGIRVDGGTAYAGAVVTRYYDPLLEKLTAWAPTVGEAVDRIDRALLEYRIRGVATNLAFLSNVIRHPAFRSGQYTTRFIDETPSLFDFRRRRDRATKLLTYVADVTVNGHPETRGRTRAAERHAVSLPRAVEPAPAGAKQILDRLGPRAFSAWLLEQRDVKITDTTMRDAHQSLLATRVRTHDLMKVAPHYAAHLSGLFSVECWGGATFDVAMRFLNEDPWERLRMLRQAMPNILTQMLLRGANGVGYTNYPDNVVRYFIAQAAKNGMDLFRVFDCLNWVENMRVAIDAICETGSIAEGAICYTGDLLSASSNKYDLKYYVGLAKELQTAGVHILGIKDMAGVLTPHAARLLVRALKEETGLPVHLHTHDTSGIAAATVLAAVDSDVDIVDCAIDSMSGATSQPCMGSIVHVLQSSDRKTLIDPEAVRVISLVWEGIRADYASFESDMRAPSSEIYGHAMPGGQYTNLREQARSIGLGGRWKEVAKAYADANLLLGDIVKVTPSSKVVGDLALLMVSQSLDADSIAKGVNDIAYPASLVDMLAGDLGQPPGGWPADLQARVLKTRPAITVRPSSLLPALDLEAQRKAAETSVRRAIRDDELASYLMYPKVFVEFSYSLRKYGPAARLPTAVFFFGMEVGEEVAVTIETGKTLNIQLTAIGSSRDDRLVEVFFELNGQPRVVRVPDRLSSSPNASRQQVEDGNERQIGAPMQGVVASIAQKAGAKIAAGDVLLSLEAMKLEAPILAPRDGVIRTIHVDVGDHVRPRDLLYTID